MKYIVTFCAVLILTATGADAVCDELTPLDCITLNDPMLSKSLLSWPEKLNAVIAHLPLSASEKPITGGTGTDAAGNFYYMTPFAGSRDVVRMTPQGVRETIITTDGIFDTDFYGNPRHLHVDAINGRLILDFEWTFTTALVVVSGLPTLLDVPQTFTPTPDQFSIQVPRFPEAFQDVDYFDTYYGDLATVGNWTQLQPLQCGYPLTPPSVGDHLTVTDTLPTPAPGTGRYYLTVANYQGERRFGRKSTGGVLSGRDPAVLPPCTE